MEGVGTEFSASMEQILYGRMTRPGVEVRSGWTLGLEYIFIRNEHSRGSRNVELTWRRKIYPSGPGGVRVGAG